MMRGLRDHITEAEQWINEPVVGDDFAINIREECLLESHVVAVTEDTVVIQGDDRLLALLESYHMLGEEITTERIRRYGPAASNRGQGFTVLEDLGNPMAQAVAGRIVMQHPEWLSQYGIEFVLQVIDDVTETESDWEEIGTSDVSAYVKMVHDQLQDRGGSRSDMAEGDIDPNRHPQTRDYGRGDDADKIKRVLQTRLDDPWDAVSRKPHSVGVDPGIKDPGKYDDPWQYVQDSEQDFQRVMELAGVQVKETEANTTDPLADKAAALAPVGADGAQEPVTTMDESVMSSIDMDLRHIAKTQRIDALVDAMRGEFGIQTQQYLQSMMDDVEQDLDQRGMRTVNMETRLEMLMDRIQKIYAGQDLDEAEYQGRKVELNKPMQGDVAKFKVYVKDPSTGNIKKVNFGDKTMRIKKSNPARRRSFRARHRCENPGPKTKARYWSCRKW